MPTLRLGPGYLLGAVVGLFVLVPNVVVSPRDAQVCVILGVLVVALAFASLTGPRRWGAAPSLLLIYLTCLILSVPHFGDMGDFVDAGLYSLLLLGAVLVADNLDATGRDQLLRTVLVVAGLQLLIGLAEQFGGLPAPFGYLGRAGSVFNENHVLPALAGETVGTMGHSIPYGTLMAFAALLCLFGRPGWTWPMRWSGAAAFAIGVVLSGSRSAAIAIVVAAVIGVAMPNTIRNAGRSRVVVFVVVVAVALFGNVQNSSVLTSLSGTGSLDHRLEALRSAGNLMNRDLVEALFGSGYGAQLKLFELGQLSQDNFAAVDNQLVSTLALGGLVGLIALVGLFGYGLLAGDRGSRPAVFSIFLMFFSFDLLEWNATAMLFAATVALGSERRSATLSGRAPRRVGVPVAQQRG